MSSASPFLRLPCTALLAAVLVLGGCLSSAYEIPKSELMALSQSPPEERAQHVRVVQNLGHHDEPPAAPHVHGGATVVVGGPVWVGGRPRPRHHQPVSTGGGGSGHQVSHGGSDLAEAKKEDAKVWIILAAVAAVALAATEGARYDGWVSMHPMHPVHLVGPNGEQTWVPLAQLDPGAAAWADRAFIRETEGPWRKLGRAPLNRQGFTYSVFLGGGEIALIGDEPQPGFVSHIDFGYFPTHTIGLGLDLAFGWADDDLGATVFDARWALELQALPVSAGRLHAGLYGQLGGASRSDDGLQLDDASGLVAGGGLLQLEITTRLALSLRAGVTRAHEETMSELGLGLSIY